MSDKAYKIFLVDDDVKTLIMLKGNLEKKVYHNVTVNIFAYGENCLDKMDEKPDIVVLDFHLDGIRENAATGLEILKKIKSISPDTQVIMMSSQEDLKIALDTIRNGAYDYVMKQEDVIARLEFLINKIIIEKEKVEQKEEV